MGKYQLLCEGKEIYVEFWKVGGGSTEKRWLMAYRPLSTTVEINEFVLVCKCRLSKCYGND